MFFFQFSDLFTHHAVTAGAQVTCQCRSNTYRYRHYIVKGYICVYVIVLHFPGKTHNNIIFQQNEPCCASSYHPESWHNKASVVIDIRTMSLYNIPTRGFAHLSSETINRNTIIIIIFVPFVLGQKTFVSAENYCSRTFLNLAQKCVNDIVILHGDIII